MGNTITVRPSSLSSYLACPRSGWIQDNLACVDEEQLNPRQMSINAKVGSCVHELISKASGDTRSLVEDWFNRNVVGPAESELVMSKTIESVDDAMRASNNVLSAFREHGLMKVFDEAEHLHEKLLERSFHTKSGNTVHLKGRLDIYRPADRELIDVKTSGQTSPGHYGAQMAAYSVLLKHVKQVETDKATVYFARINKQMAPAIVRQSYDIGANKQHFIQVVRLMELANTMAGENGDPRKVVASPGCWKCSKQWCRAFDTPYCPETHTTKVNTEKH